MVAVLDVCGAMEVLMKNPKGEKFNTLLQTASLRLAPDLYVSELSNTLWKYYRAKLLTFDECNQYIERGINLIDIFINSKEIWKEAFAEGIKNNHPVYDMYYAVIARRNSGILVTNDGDLAKICKKNSIGYIF
ncbi:hypothetical protein AGMMS50268_25570 [Spirochaetia bacterium]|nr:hypothetical protein AGMMS50268_25570 [Spirochaetia bacterium]